MLDNHDISLEYAPEAWKSFVNGGRESIHALCSKKIVHVPTKAEQLQLTEEGRNIINSIHAYFANNKWYGFEACAVDIVRKLDPRFEDFVLTRPTADGGRDAIGHYVIRSELPYNVPLRIDCALEAKCYDLTTGVGVTEMARLISRIRAHEFGIMVTTSYVCTQAYKEVIDDGHPILILSATDIAHVLIRNGIRANSIADWISSSQTRYRRLP